MRVGKPHWRDVVFGLAIVSVAGAFLHQTGRIRKTPFDILGAAYFPRIVSVVLIVLGLIVAVRALVGKATEDSEVVLFAGGAGENAPAARWPLALAMFILTVGYAAALDMLQADFLFATVIYLAFAGWLIAGGGRINAIRAAIFGVVGAGAITLIFKTVLGVDLS